MVQSKKIICNVIMLLKIADIHYIDITPIYILPKEKISVKKVDYLVSGGDSGELLFWKVGVNSSQHLRGKKIARWNSMDRRQMIWVHRVVTTSFPRWLILKFLIVISSAIIYRLFHTTWYTAVLILVPT